MDNNSRLASLWPSKQAKQILNGIILDSKTVEDLNIVTSERLPSGDAIITRPSDMAKGIGKAWEETFTAKPIDTEAVEIILSQYDKVWDWSLSSPPDRPAVEGYMASLKHCAPGKDGAINEAWKNSGPAGVDFIVASLQKASSAATLPPKAREGLFVFPAKPTSGGDANEGDRRLLRKPKDLRPLTLKNADNKAVAGITNYAILPTVQVSASQLQRGFVPGRQLAQNCIDLDFAARFASLKFMTDNLSWRFNLSLLALTLSQFFNLPFLALFDYAAAFPSVAHAWILAVLKHIKVPRGVLNIFKALYDGNEGFTSIGGLITWMFTVGCGVLQGCPLSGSLFVIAIDPLLFLFEKYICSPGFGTVSACADDIGAVVNSLKGLKRLKTLFSLMTRASGLTLKPAKCILIPLACDVTPENVDRIHGWLGENIPEWASMNVKNMGKYLGIFIGPGVTDEANWAEPCRKFEERSSQVASSGLPAALIPHQFMSKAISVLGYVGQMVKPPANFKSLELRMATKIFGFATNSMTTNEIYNLGHFGGPSLNRPKVYLHACRARACIKTFSGFDEKHKQLVAAFTEASVLRNLLPGASTPDGWNSPALCTNLFEMFHGHVSDKDFPNLGAIIRKHSRLCSSDNKHGVGLQKKISKDLMLLTPNKWTKLLTRRFAALGIEPDFSLAQDFPKHFIRVTKSLPPQTRMISFKTWANSWASTERYHEEEILGCVFGCGGEDNILHYLKCDILWTLVIGVAHPQIKYLCPDVSSGELPAYRAGLRDASKASISILAIAFKTYHALKMDYRPTIQRALASHNFEEVYLICTELIKLFASDFPLT